MDSPNPTSHEQPGGCLVLCTFPSRDVAEKAAHILLAERLIACASLLPGLTSIYRWEGHVQSEEEVLVFLKTSADRYTALEKRLLALHPYDVPEILAFHSTSGLTAYLDWLLTSTRPQPIA